MKIRYISSIIIIILIIFAQTVWADDWYDKYGEYYKVYNVEDSSILFKTAREVSRGDQYLSSDNKMYRVIRVNKRNRTSFAEFIEEVILPEIDEEAFNNIKMVLRNSPSLAGQILQNGEGRVGIYTTHSSESYVPTDGAESIQGDGGILKVAEQFAKAFEEQGVEAQFDNTSHDPHDAGAYKRSRRTALQIIREHQPDAIIDVHRDAIPKEKYLTEIDGDPAAKVRLVVGRRNQNFKANEETALKIKSVADKMHPGLVKDIFYANGDYNQDLTPRAILVEMGTYQHTRQRAEKSAQFLAEVITTSLYGGTFKDKTDGNTEAVSPQANSNRGSIAGIVGVIAVIGGGGLAFLFLSSGGKEWKSKLSNFRQEFANFLGRNKNRK